MKGRFDGQAVAVWGAARSGVAAANLLVELGARVTLSDAKPLDQILREEEGKQP